MHGDCVWGLTLCRRQNPVDTSGPSRYILPLKWLQAACCRAWRPCTFFSDRYQFLTSPDAPSLQSTGMFYQASKCSISNIITLKFVKNYIYCIIFIRCSAPSLAAGVTRVRRGWPMFKHFWPCWPMRARCPPSQTSKHSVPCCLCTE